MMRYHPLSIGYRIYQFIKSSFLVILLLFVLRKDSESWIFVYGRYAFLLVVVFGLFYIVASWFVEKYEWKDRSFHIHKGIFVKRSSTIPFSRIQNVTRKTSVFHKIFGLTSLTFETAMDGEDDSIQFDVLTKKHADFLIDLVQPDKHQAVTKEHEETEQAMVLEPTRKVHFTPEKKDLWKASFTSLSFLAIVPIVFAGLDYAEPFFPDPKQVKGIFQVLLASKWLFAIILMVAVVVAVAFGVARTFIRYGRYVISSDENYIYIDRGVLNESYFAIEKRKIQGLEMKQTWLKRIFGLAEVILISLANPNNGDESVNVNSLYPFLPVQKAYELIEELLPIYQLNETRLERSPRKSLWIKLLRISWIWVLVTIGLFYFKPEPFGLSQAWWMLSLVLLCLVVLQRFLDFIHTRFSLKEDQVQWWQGGLTSRMFITKRRHVIEMSYYQTRFQRFFEVASITTMNRSTPTHIETIHDVPLPFARTFEQWYLQRQDEVEIMESNEGNPTVLK
ncbi:PH domain-containing protein [Bacillus sp. JJ1533]|uniref:PH domain-containing protein n=1 Tax=Bacillus sp. JJ1533 TaxID=3122959 RepID=UPI002FFEE300